MMFHFMENFPENEGDSRKLEKVEELIQNFSEQCSGGQGHQPMFRKYDENAWNI